MASPILDYWGTLQTRCLRLETAVVLLTLMTASLTGLTAWLATRPLPIYYVPATLGPGLLRPGEIPEALAADLAQQLLLLLYNVTPATAAAAQQAVEKYLHPTLLVPFRVQAEQERQRMAAEDLSAQLSIRGVQVTRLPERQQVTLAALRRVYVGKLPVRDEEVDAVVSLLPVRPSVLNPYGLVVTDLRVTPALGEPAAGKRVATASAPRRSAGGLP
jgi:hypothetical protein